MIRRGGAALATSLLAISLSGVASSPASAASSSAGSTAAGPTAGIAFNYWVDATTTLKKLKQTVKVPRGTFSGSIDPATWELTGHIALPQAKAPFKAAGIPLATATFKMTELKPVTGNLDVNTTIVTATSVVSIQIVSIVPLGTSLNLVGNSCKTSKPVSVTMAGPFSSTTFSGVYTIPPLQNCGALTRALNLVVPGPGNTFSAVVTPR
jgi:hypothetical protein